MKILVSRPDKIGDVILALHGVKQLKRLLPDAQVYMHVSAYTAPLVENVRFVDGCVLLGEDLRKFRFDAVVDLMAKNSTARLYIRPQIKLRIGNSARWFRFFYNRTRYLRRSYGLMNEAEYNWQLISLLSESLRHTRLVDSLSRDDFKEWREFNELSNFYVLMPGVSVSALQWGQGNWLKLARLLSPLAPVVILLGPAEAALQEHFESELQSFENIRVRSFADFKDVIGLLRAAKAYVGPSTGLTHLASALGLSGIGLYPEIRSMHPDRWMPFHTSLNIISLSSSPNAEDLFNILQTNEVPSRLAPTRRAPISAFVVCLNEERNIRRCLESIAWCDEIIVVDSGSTDRTVEICREFTDKIYHREWRGHSEQKQFALEHCSHDWVLNIDSDEEVSTELKAEICRVLTQPESARNKIHGYFVSRLVRFLDRWWDRGGWFPEYRMRFFQRKFTHWGGINPHEKAIVQGKKKKIRGEIYHYTYTGIGHQLECLNKHSTNSAKHLYMQGRRSTLLNIIANPAMRFFKFYVLKRGYRQGLEGFIVACIEAMYTFLKYAKLWELERVVDAQQTTAKQTKLEIESCPQVDHDLKLTGS